MAALREQAARQGERAIVGERVHALLPAAGGAQPLRAALGARATEDGTHDASCSRMRAGELCIRDVVTAELTDSIVDAARRMAVLDVGDLVVVDHPDRGLPRPVGIVTDRDLVVNVLAHPERSPIATRIEEIMRRDLVVAQETEEVEGVVDKMRQHTIRRVPIVDDHGRLQGVLCLDDVLGWMRDQLQAASRLVELQAQGPLAQVRGR